MSKTYRSYERPSDAFKIKICELVSTKEMTRQQCCDTYGIKSSTNIMRWLRKFGYEEIPTQALLTMSSENREDPILLKQRIKELEEQLKLEKIRSEGLNIIIDLAEKDLNVPIRKKAVTKRSKK